MADEEAGYSPAREETAVGPTSLRGSFFQANSKQETKDLTWCNVNMTLKSSKGTGVEKHILRNVYGEAKGGELTAIMGASGAGKTSLFNVLSGRTRTKGRIVVEADICLGGAKIDPNKSTKIRTMFAFVAQEDALHDASTPRQALKFSARLRLPRSTTEKEINNLVDLYLDELGLVSCSDTVIGGGLKKGISGGEKKRVSIGIELISQPDIIFLDEPTSGLDSFAAKQVMKLLHKVAQAGNIVLFTIHQPSSEIFATFDRLILLNQGRLMYQGLIRYMNQDFLKNGYPVPPNYNPADWMLDIAQTTSIDDLSNAGFFSDDERPANSPTAEFQVVPRDSASFWTQLIMLTLREKTSLVKNPAPMIINCVLTGVLALVFGVIFYQVGEANRSDPVVVQSQVGALMNILMTTMMGQSQTALLIFTSDRPLFLREYSTDHYSILPYFLSHLATEALQAFVAMVVQSLITYFMIGFQLTFFQLFFMSFGLAMTTTAVVVMLGAATTDIKSAQALFPLVVVPQFYFSGVFIAINLIPQWIRWLQYLCSMTYAARLAFAYEFTDCDPGLASANCALILDRNGVDPEDTWWYWLALVALFLSFRLVALLFLRKRGMEFS